MVSKLVLLCALLSACTPQPKMPEFKLTPEHVTGSVYKVTADLAGMPQWTGTAWKYDEGRFLSAGHVCDTNGADLRFTLIDSKDNVYPAQVVRFDAKVDLCIMSAVGVPGLSLKFGVEPGYGADVWYTGAPNGVWGAGIIPFARGYTIGGHAMMIAGYGGASGSPVYDHNGVFGVLVSGWRGTHLINYVEVARIKAFLRGE